MITDKSTGFTLIELAVVLFIVGLLLAGLFTPVATSIDRERRQKLEREYEQIEEALIGFVIINGRFPCPDCRDATIGVCNDGEEDLKFEDPGDPNNRNHTCLVGTDTDPQVEGNLPWADLGVTGGDPWGRILAYRVQQDHADTDTIGGTDNDNCSTRTGVSFQLCSTAGITVKDLGEDCSGTPANIATDVPAVVYSEGNHLATSCNELENTDDDATFVSRGYSTDETGYYDDMIFWISPKVLVTKMVDAEILP